MKSLAIRFFLSVLAIGSLPAFATATPDPDTRATEAADTGGPLATGLIPNPDFNGTGKLVLMPSTSGGWALRV